jgi:hypothetical protein
MGDTLAIAAGSIRLASGLSFLVAPERANALWSSDGAEGPTASLLLRSMGYRDALVGGLLLNAGLRLADLVGGIANHDRLRGRSRVMGIGGAVVGVAVGVAGALRARRSR